MDSADTTLSTPQRVPRLVAHLIAAQLLGKSTRAIENIWKTALLRVKERVAHDEIATRTASVLESELSMAQVLTLDVSPTAPLPNLQAGPSLGLAMPSTFRARDVADPVFAFGEAGFSSTGWNPDVSLFATPGTGSLSLNASPFPLDPPYYLSMVTPETPTGVFSFQAIPPSQPSSSSPPMVTTPLQFPWDSDPHFSPLAHPVGTTPSWVASGFLTAPSETPAVPIMQGIYDSSSHVSLASPLPSAGLVQRNATPQPRCVPRTSPLIICPFPACNGGGTIDVGGLRNLTTVMIKKHIGLHHSKDDTGLQEFKTCLDKKGADVRCPLVRKDGSVCGTKCQTLNYGIHCSEQHCSSDMALWECTVPRCNYTHGRRYNAELHASSCWASYQQAHVQEGRHI